jgi:hypothetical protein
MKEGVGGFEELAETASPMFVGEDGVHGEVAAHKKASPGNGKLAALVNDVPRVVEATAVGA